tara:strand:+ start:22 stop:2022 length:2001 start_codon:yes stop_codon:yes gene_type:complete
MQAFDWEANNLNAVDGTDALATNPGGYDAVNIYGDEDTDGNLNDVRGDINQNYFVFPGVGKFYRTGYQEKDVVDYNTKNLKFATALHYKIQEDFELIYSMNYGTGTTVYQGDNRFSLNGIQFLQNRIELNKKDKFFIRAYRSQEDAGDSYDAVFTALKLQSYNGTNNQDWYTEYKNNFQENFNWQNVGWETPGYDFINQQWIFQGQNILLDDWMTLSDSVINSNTDLIIATHNAAREETDNYINRLEPGTDEFNEAFEDITSKISYLQGGTGFYDKSSLNHIHSEYQFKQETTNFKLGANFRQYTPDSKGSIFMDTASAIINNEFGVYAGTEIKLFGEYLKFNGTIRADKNENFDLNFSPAASIVYKPNSKDIIRFSFGSALRNPTLSDQYLYYNVGRAILIGNLSGHGEKYGENLVTVESLLEYFTPFPYAKDSLEFFSVDPIKPEKANSIELGYRSTISSKIYVDANIYYSKYTDFIGYKIGVKFDTIGNINANAYEISQNSIQAYRIAANAENTVTTKGASIGINYYPNNNLSVNGNYSWNKLNESGTNDPIIPAYNTPEHKFNLGLLMKNIHFSEKKSILRDFSSSLTYKWIEGYNFEGSPQFTGLIPSYDILDIQISKKIPELDATLKIGSTNILNNLHYEVYGGPYIGRMTYCSILFDIK